AAIEYRRKGVTHAVRHAMAFARIQRVQEDGAHVAKLLPRVGKPLAIGRPCGPIDLLRAGEPVVKDLHGLFLFEVDVPEIEPFVRVRDLLAVRRPSREIKEGWW